MRTMDSIDGPMSQLGQQRSSHDVCVTSAIIPTGARKRTFRHFAFVPTAEVITPEICGYLHRLAHLPRHLYDACRLCLRSKMSKDYARNRFFPGKGPATAAGKH